jgi:hypothetical protein
MDIGFFYVRKLSELANRRLVVPLNGGLFEIMCGRAVEVYAYNSESQKSPYDLDSVNDTFLINSYY